MEVTNSQALLAEYVRSGSDPAFRELVGCYVNLVYSAAVRLVDGDAHRAQDVTQTVFIDLAKMAPRLPSNVLLGGWLHRHTCFVASNLLRRERRRQTRERQAVEMNALHESPENTMSHIAPYIDEAIQHLSAEERDAVVLRFFEQMEFRAVGAALGTSEEAARKRVSRALEKLHLLLKARGVTTTAAALTAVLAAEAVQAAPVGLGAAVAGTALAGLSSTISTLTIVKTMIFSKTAAGLTGAALIASVTFSARQYENQAQLRQQSAALKTQLDESLTRAEALSSQLREARAAAAAANESVQELMRARGEVASLRRQAADAASAAAKQPRSATAAAPEPDPAEQMKLVGITKMRNAKIWTDALYQFAGRHGNLFPTNLDEASSLLDGALRNDLNPGDVLRAKDDFLQTTNDFELVYRGSVTNIVDHMNSVIVMREKDAWQGPNGEWNRTYGFADGHTEIHHAADGDFSKWEAQHMAVPAAEQ